VERREGEVHKDGDCVPSVAEQLVLADRLVCSGKIYCEGVGAAAGEHVAGRTGVYESLEFKVELATREKDIDGRTL
jgi:hypothetical protein